MVAEPPCGPVAETVWNPGSTENILFRQQHNWAHKSDKKFESKYMQENHSVCPDPPSNTRLDQSSREESTAGSSEFDFFVTDRSEDDQMERNLSSKEISSSSDDFIFQF